MKTVLICNAGSLLSSRVLPSFLCSFSELVGIVLIRETRSSALARLRREWRRSRWRVVDVLAFRAFYAARLARRDRAWTRRRAVLELERFPAPAGVPIFETEDPNSSATRDFLLTTQPDLAVAACKRLLRPEIFNIPPAGTFVVHPGICPEYRNAHGCFWALARRDLDRVGATLLRIDEGVDTGPVFGYYRTEFDELRESHVVIQHRVVYDNLEDIARDLQDVFAGRKRAADVSGRKSAAWGQPRLTDYIRWKRAARRPRASALVDTSEEGAELG